jgi:hypothetical protein
MSYDPTDCPQCAGFHPGQSCDDEPEAVADEDEETFRDCGGYSPDTKCGDCEACLEERADNEELYGPVV